MYVIDFEEKWLVCDDPRWLQRVAKHGTSILMRDLDRICPTCKDIAIWILRLPVRRRKSVAAFLSGLDRR